MNNYNNNINQGIIVLTIKLIVDTHINERLNVNFTLSSKFWQELHTCMYSSHLFHPMRLIRFHINCDLKSDNVSNFESLRYILPTFNQILSKSWQQQHTCMCSPIFFIDHMLLFSAVSHISAKIWMKMSKIIWEHQYLRKNFVDNSLKYEANDDKRFIRMSYMSYLKALLTQITYHLLRKLSLDYHRCY